MDSGKENINDLVNQSRLVFGMKNPDGQYLYVNEEFVQLFGRCSEEFLGRTDHDIFDEECANAFREADLKVIESRQKLLFEELAEVDGEQRTYLSVKFPVWNADQSLVGVGLVAIDITGAQDLKLSLERHHQILREKAAQLQYIDSIQNAIANNSLFSIVTIDGKGIIKTFNKTAEQVFGYQADEVLGRSVNVLIPEAIRASHDRYLEAYRASPDTSSFGRGRVITGRHKEGSLIPFEIDLLNLEYEGRENFTIILYDLSQYQKVLGDLRTSEERFNRSHRIANIGTWEWNITTGELYWSENVYEMVGVKPGEVKPNFDLFSQKVHPDDLQAVNEAISVALNYDIPYKIEHRYAHPVKGSIWMLERGEVIRDEDGTPVSMIGVAEDITDRKEIELQKNTIRETHEDLILALGELTYEHYVAEEKIHWSGAYEEMLGYSREEMGDDDPSWLTRVHPEDLDRVLAEFERAKKEDLLFDVTYRFRTRSGDYLWFHDRGIMKLDEAGNLITNIGVMKNITDRVRTEQEIARKHTILQSVTKIQTSHLAKQDFKQAFELLLDELIELTDSEYGFLGEVLNSSADKPYLKIHAITDISWNEATQKLYQENYEKGLEFQNLNTLFGCAIATGEIVISNCPTSDPRSGGLPEGHPELNAFLGMPIYSGNDFVGMLGIANRPGGYEQSLIDEITPILNTGAGLIEALRTDQRRIRTETALRENEEKFRTVFNSSHDAIIIANEQGEFVDCNEAALKLLGFTNHNQFLDRTVLDISPDIIFGEKKEVLIKKHIDNAIKNGYERMEWVHLNTSGESIPCDVALSVLELDGEKYIQGIVRDNTEKQNAIERQKALQRQLLQSQKMESIGHLTGGIAHDFNNILGSVIGFAELSQNLITDSDVKLSMYIEEILIAGERARSLVEQMLAFSRGDVGKPVNLLPVNPVQEAVNLLRPAIPSSIDIVLDVQDEDVPVFIDPTQLHQMIMNLIINSRDALTNEKGHIKIKLCAQNNISHTCDSCHETFSGDFIQITIQDDGCGIPEECLPRIFDPFFTTKEIGKGTGMGLSVVHGIAHANNGHITVESDVNSGTQIKLYFPVEIMKVTSVADKYRMHRQSALNPERKNILVVDDERAMTIYLSEILEAQGYVVTASNSSLEAHLLFKSNPSRFDLVISDQTMPGLTGVELIRGIFTVKPDMPVILCTGYSATVDEQAALDMGIKAFMNKPLDSNRLLTTIRNLLAGDIYSTKSNTGE